MKMWKREKHFFFKTQSRVTISFASFSTLCDPLCLLLTDEFSFSLITTNCAALITFQNSLLSINQLERVWRWWVLENESTSEYVSQSSLLTRISFSDQCLPQKWQEVLKKRASFCRVRKCLDAACIPVIPIHKSYSSNTKRGRQGRSKFMGAGEMPLRTVMCLELSFKTPFRKLLSRK